MTNDSLTKTIRASGHRLTKQRQCILDCLLADKRPMTAAQIHAKLRSAADLASIYRALHLFQSMGIAFEELLGTETAYYAAERPHHHIICSDCREVECVPCTHVPVRSKRFRNITHAVILRGICYSCEHTS